MRLSQSVLLPLLIGLLMGCAGQTPSQATPSPPAPVVQSPKEALRTRATQLWEARVKGDLATQYDLLEPKAREQVTLTGFVRARSSVTFQSYQMQDVEVNGDEGTVTTMAKFRLNLPKVSQFGPWDQLTTMKWVKVNGLWYFAYNQKDVKPPVQAGEKQP
jgi:hypothetical protein